MESTVCVLSPSYSQQQYKCLKPVWKFLLGLVRSLNGCYLIVFVLTEKYVYVFFVNCVNGLKTSLLQAYKKCCYKYSMSIDLTYTHNIYYFTISKRQGSSKQEPESTQISCGLHSQLKEKSYHSSVYFWPHIILTSRSQPFWPIRTLFTCRFGETQRVFTCKHGRE